TIAAIPGETFQKYVDQTRKCEQEITARDLCIFARHERLYEIGKAARASAGLSDGPYQPTPEQKQEKARACRLLASFWTPPAWGDKPTKPWVSFFDVVCFVDGSAPEVDIHLSLSVDQFQRVAEALASEEKVA